MFIICKRCFEKIFMPLAEQDYKECVTKSECIICREERILIQPTCSLKKLAKEIELEEKRLEEAENNAEKKI